MGQIDLKNDLIHLILRVCLEQSMENDLIHQILKVCFLQSIVIIGQNVLTLQIHEVYSQPSTVITGQNDNQIHEVYSQPSMVITMVDTRNDTIQSETFIQAINVLTNPMIQGVSLEQFMAIENKQKIFEQMLDQDTLIVQEKYHHQKQNQQQRNSTFFGAIRIR